MYEKIGQLKMIAVSKIYEKKKPLDKYKQKFYTICIVQSEDVIKMNNESNIAPINEELNVVEYDIEDIKKRIYTIRGKQVMLDSDVAMLYNCETKYVNRVVKRNIERFPEDFCFQLTEIEFENMRCQFVTASEK